MKLQSLQKEFYRVGSVINRYQRPIRVTKRLGENAQLLLKVAQNFQNIYTTAQHYETFLQR